jgi:hypothetical protein
LPMRGRGGGLTSRAPVQHLKDHARWNNRNQPNIENPEGISVAVQHLLRVVLCRE